VFYDNPNVERLAPKVFIYRNFIDEETCKLIEGLMKPWEHQAKKSFFADNLIDWYHGKTSPRIPQLYDVWCKMNELLLPEYCIHPQITLLTTQAGDEMFIHSDSPGESMEQDLTGMDTWNTCCVLHYGAIVYFGNWEGGEVFYPHVNKDGEWVGDNKPLIEGNELRINPGRGDLVIHGAHDDYSHGVHEITSGTRYAFSNFVLPVEKNPGTFPIYGTKENEERWANGGINGPWLEPIGFQWEPPEKLKKEMEEKKLNALPTTTKFPSEYTIVSSYNPNKD
jgi:hypothetical protein